MKKGVDDRFIQYLREFFTIYLPKQKNCSPHTITSCKQTWNLLLSYVVTTYEVRLENVSFSCLNRKTVTAFLAQMVQDRGWSPATHNQRLGCIRSFFKYAAGIDSTNIIYLQDLCGIPLKKGIDNSRVVEFLGQDSMKAILQQPDITTKAGIRDQFFMILMYDTAARDCEMLGMRFSDFNVDDKTVYLMGKGLKPRLVPVTNDTVEHFKRFAQLFHADKDGRQPMFHTIHNGKKTSMSDDNVARFMKKYAEAAKMTCPEIPERVHPHMFRRSRAMHLYRAGMPLALLAEWLGHEDPETTLIYAHADTEMKRKAIQMATTDSDPMKDVAVEPIWENDADMIRRLCGLT